MTYLPECLYLPGGQTEQQLRNIENILKDRENYWLNQDGITKGILLADKMAKKTLIGT